MMPAQKLLHWALESRAFPGAQNLSQRSSLSSPAATSRPKRFALLRGHQNRRLSNDARRAAAKTEEAAPKSTTQRMFEDLERRGGFGAQASGAGAELSNDDLWFLKHEPKLSFFSHSASSLSLVISKLHQVAPLRMRA